MIEFDTGATSIGLGVVIALILKVVFTAWQPSSGDLTRVGPLVTLLISVGTAVVIALAQGLTVQQGIVAGILIAGTSTLTYSTGKAGATFTAGGQAKLAAKRRLKAVIDK